MATATLHVSVCGVVMIVGEMVHSLEGGSSVVVHITEVWWV